MRALVFFVLLLSACSGYDDLALLEIETVEPSEVEPGGTLRIQGSGFPLGRAPAIVLRGTVHRPGLQPRTVSAKLTGTVQSESLIEIPIEDTLIDALGGRATLDGELRVGFRAADDHRDVFSTEKVRIDLLPDTTTLLRVNSAHDEQAESAGARSFGLELSREDLGTVGVRVESVDSGGLAAMQGVRAGDVLVGLDGMSLYSARDFLPDPSRSESTVLVARDGLSGVHSLRWPHEATERPFDPIALGLFVLLGLLLGWVSPVTLCLRPRAARVSLTTWLTRASLILVLAGLLLSIPALQWTTMWILGLGTFAALLTLATRYRAGATSFAFAVIAALTVMLLARTASISAIVAAQTPSVLRWYLFQSPASFLAFGAYLFALAAVTPREGFSPSLYSAAAAVFGAALFLGGWPLADSAVGIAVLVTKSVALLLTAQVFDMSRKAATGCAGLGLGLASIGLFVDLGALFPQWSALAVGCVCAVSVRALVPPLRRQSTPALV